MVDTEEGSSSADAGVEPSGVIRRIELSPDMESYVGFFDHAWERRTSSRSRGTNIHHAVLDLATTWKGVSVARSMPRIAVSLVKSGIEGVVNARVPMPLEVIRGLLDYVRAGGKRTLGGRRRLPLSKTIRLELENRARTVEERVLRADADMKVAESEVWGWFLASSEMQLSLWASEQSAFCLVYGAYEHFLIRTMEIVRGRDGLRAQSLEKELRSHLGRDHAKAVWENEQRRHAGAKRHAVLHNGCRITKELQGCRNKLSMVADDEFAIRAEETTSLFNLLKDLAFQHVEVVVELGSRTD